ncbi:TIGR03084 family metal-binding protein [Nocardioides ganghwensis]|uniref:TIGR03084 family protein n=1 Tax=Nocardioides ganghwensis TaxID=252230 RepID=A0A4Q2SJF3_9ACTN|nr:TIGR03084 family metal-binding protein [Nocardioides ganghwensis]MBD3944920.1 TIGR03084 family protein [Nocardioides ganghwensis]RYC05071.1 TIGR03084 family protein [Nocardioides ganghwensis]
MTDVLTQVLVDLEAEGDRLEQLVAGLDDDGWRTPTPAPGWDVATQVAHLAWTDVVALKAATDKEAWDAVVLDAIADPAGFVDAQALALAHEPDLLARWRRARADLRDALVAMPQGEKMPWFGPPMSPTSMATARLMETWAHSLDVHEALGADVEDTDRIRHVAHLGVRTRNFAFSVHGLEPPADEFRIDLASPSGEVWSWGPEDAGQTLTGSAGDFCRLVTQRVHRADTDLVASGADVDRWLDIAQAFAGQPGEGRAPR